MNKVININFQGRILPIEELAYETLKQYIDSLRAYFAKEEGRDEIINDIECRIAELCEDRLKKASVCITVDAINLIIASIGRPADFEAQEGFENTSQFQSSASASSTNTHFEAGQNNKRLYRDEQNKVLGGVCSGIANYFGIEKYKAYIESVLADYTAFKVPKRGAKTEKAKRATKSGGRHTRKHRRN